MALQLGLLCGPAINSFSAVFSRHNVAFSTDNASSAWSARSGRFADGVIGAARLTPTTLTSNEFATENQGSYKLRNGYNIELAIGKPQLRASDFDFSIDAAPCKQYSVSYPNGIDLGGLEDHSQGGLVRDTPLVQRVR